MRTLATVLKFSLVIMIIALISSCSNSKANDSETPSAPAPALPVDVIVARETSLEQTEAIAGTVLPNRSVDIMSELPKKITAVLFSDGSPVSRGQVLYKLDDADILARLRQLQAELNMARINERRLKELLSTETVRREEYDIALTRLLSQQAAEDALKVELSKTSIRAPFSGMTGITRVFAGSLVSPGMPLVTLQEQSMVKIRFTVSEKYLPVVKKGSTVYFQTELGEERFPARIVATEAGVDQQSRNLVVEALAENAKGHFRPGMSARVFFNTTAATEKAIYIPSEALIPGSNGYNVFLVQNGMARLNPVKLRNRNEQQAVISEGITSGDTVMVSNLLRAMNGTPVSIASIQ